MPLPFNPAKLIGRARGLSLVEGESSAAARRAAALRRLATQPAAEDLQVIGQGGVERSVRPGFRYSPTASAEQEMRMEAMKRHARARPTTAYESPFARGFPRDLTDAELRSRGLDPADFKPVPTEDPRSWFTEDDVGVYKPPDAGSVDTSGVTAAQDRMLRRTAELRDKVGVTDQDMLRAFADRYGWAPKTWREAEVILSPADYNELLDGLLGRPRR